MNANLQQRSLTKSLARYVSLNVLSMLGMSAYILADTFFIANNVGNNGVTALNIVLPFFSLLNGTGMILGVGGATRYSQARGAGDKEKADRIFTEVSIIAGVIGAIWMILGTVGARWVCSILGADETIIDTATEYLRGVSYFAIPFTYNHVMQCFVRNDGAPTLAMCGLLSSSFGNVIMDYVLMYPLGLGMFGAAFATGFSSVVSLSVMSLHFIRRKNQFKFVRPTFKREDISFTLKTGLPSFITEMSNGIVVLFFNMVIYSIAGNVGISAYGVVANLALVAMFCFNGVGQGIQPIVSYNYGAKERKNVKSSLFFGLIVAFSLGAIFYIAFFFGRGWLVKIFNKDNVEQMTLLGKQGIVLYCIAFFASGINLVSASFFASVGKQMFSFAVSISRGMLLPIAFVFINSKLWGIVGVWLVIPMAEFITLLLNGVLFLITTRDSKKQKKTLETAY